MGRFPRRLPCASSPSRQTIRLSRGAGNNRGIPRRLTEFSIGEVTQTGAFFRASGESGLSWQIGRERGNLQTGRLRPPALSTKRKIFEELARYTL